MGTREFEYSRRGRPDMHCDNCNHLEAENTQLRAEIAQLRQELEKPCIHEISTDYKPCPINCDLGDCPHLPVDRPDTCNCRKDDCKRCGNA